MTVTLLALSLLIAVTHSATPAPPTVTLPTNATITGVWTELPTAAFHNLQFAASPIANLRFAPPQHIPPSSTDVDATTRGEVCPQLDVHNNIFYGKEEDCLNLSVFTPDVAGSLPVMVWLFGGGFAVGDGTEFGLYEGTELTRKDVVVVTPNYRVGALGFLASDHLADTNFGLLDQRMALHWVQENIHLFGGDPSRVTIMGQSAGAMSVCAHYANGKASEGLFHAAIMQVSTTLRARTN